MNIGRHLGVRIPLAFLVISIGASFAEAQGFPVEIQTEDQLVCQSGLCLIDAKIECTKKRNVKTSMFMSKKLTFDGSDVVECGSATTECEALLDLLREDRARDWLHWPYTELSQALNETREESLKRVGSLYDCSESCSTTYLCSGAALALP